MKIQYLNEHVIYGEWDDTKDNQVLVHYPPSGDYCTVFIMDGIDYGGGIWSFSETVPWKEVDALVRKYQEGYDYDFKQEIVTLVNEHGEILL